MKVPFKQQDGSVVNLECREPTHAELDIGDVYRHLTFLVSYQRKIQAEEDAPSGDSARKILNYLQLCNQVLDAIDTMLYDALAAIVKTDIDLDGLFGAEGEARQVNSWENMQALLGAVEAAGEDVEGFTETSGPSGLGGEPTNAESISVAPTATSSESEPKKRPTLAS